MGSRNDRVKDRNRNDICFDMKELMEGFGDTSGTVKRIGYKSWLYLIYDSLDFQ